MITSCTSAARNDLIQWMFTALSILCYKVLSLQPHDVDLRTNQHSWRVRTVDDSIYEVTWATVLQNLYRIRLCFWSSCGIIVFKETWWSVFIKCMTFDGLTFFFFLCVYFLFFLFWVSVYVIIKMVLLILCNIPIVILEYRVSLIRQYLEWYGCWNFKTN